MDVEDPAVARIGHAVWEPALNTAPLSARIRERVSRMRSRAGHLTEATDRAF
jgi:hypothetical protein